MTDLFGSLVFWLLTYIEVGLVLFMVTWACLVYIMWVEKSWETWTPTVYALNVIPTVFAVIVGWVGDVIWNIFWATPIFKQWPDIKFDGSMRIHDITLSHRLRQILRNDTDITEDMIRWSIADFICEYCIEPSDCTHCGRNK